MDDERSLSRQCVFLCNIQMCQQLLNQLIIIKIVDKLFAINQINRVVCNGHNRSRVVAVGLEAAILLFNTRSDYFYRQLLFSMATDAAA